jgi:hypothetical protein
MTASLPQQIEVKTKLMPNKVGALFMKGGAAKTRPTIEMVNAVEGVDLVVWVGPLRTSSQRMVCHYN